MQNFDSYVHSRIFSKGKKTKQKPKTKQIKKKTLKKSETVANDFIIGDIATVDLQGLCVCSRLK